MFGLWITANAWNCRFWFFRNVDVFNDKSTPSVFLSCTGSGSCSPFSVCLLVYKTPMLLSLRKFCLSLTTEKSSLLTRSVPLVFTCWAATSTFPIFPMTLPPNRIGIGFPDWRPIFLEKYGYTPLLEAKRYMFAPSRKKSLFSGNLIGNLVRFICLSSTSVSAKSVLSVTEAFRPVVML